MDIASSPEIKQYFQTINAEVKHCYDVAQQARAKGLDPEEEVNIPLANNMAERVVGLVSVVSPQINDPAIIQRILELEKEYGLLDWRVGFKIAEEVAKEKFSPFKSKHEAMEVGIRVGFAYLTLGIVSAPLEGFIGLKIKQRQDGKEYFALQYAGPIRGAGGTAASTSVILGDYVRVVMGYAAYDPDEKEINRYTMEIHDYHERVTNLQYHPSDEEIRFLVSHLPVEVDGDPTEKIEVSNYKDLPRIETNCIRGGMALVLAEGLSQKAPKLWKRLSKWGKDFGLQWEWLADFLKVKEQIHASHSPKTEVTQKKVKANNTFIMDLVAGRPILTYPLAPGGFRLRYGRTRATGFSACALHPATLIVLDKYIAIGTQLKVERPGKAASVTVCDTIEGPTVKLRDGSVLRLKTEEEAKKVNSDVEEIIFLGDILFNYGDFSENGQLLVPAGYCPEWWALDVKEALEHKKASLQRVDELLSNPLLEYPSFDEARMLSHELGIPLHPDYTYYWKLIPSADLIALAEWLREGKLKIDEQGIKKIILPYYFSNPIHVSGKQVLESAGLPHQVVNKENIVIEKTEATALCLVFNLQSQKDLEQLTIPADKSKTALDIINQISPVTIRDKAGTFIGARMGRPEKAKMRQLTGSPQVMFPVGEEGDRLRSFQSAMDAGKVLSSFPCRYCVPCQKEMIYPRCEQCGEKTIQRHHCRSCGDVDAEQCRHGPARPYKEQALDIKYYFSSALSRLGENIYPDLIKGIRGTSNKYHIVEHLAKGILRAKHLIYVNKDGTTRYDCTELPITHFKPKEIKTSVAKLKELGYLYDIQGTELADEDQILELKPQDLILPGFDSLDESAPKVLRRVTQFVDDLLVKFYGLGSFYGCKNEEDLIGHLVIGLAPHISAGLIGRIIGFSETQGLLAHPMYHAGLRRDCFTRDTLLPIYDGKEWRNEALGELVERLNPQKVVDAFGTTEVNASEYYTFGLNTEKKLSVVKINNFTKHAPRKIITLKTATGRRISVTLTHKFITKKNESIKTIAADKLTVGDLLLLPKNAAFPENPKRNLNLSKVFSGRDDIVIRNVKQALKIPLLEISRKLNINYHDIRNYYFRNSFPLSVFEKIVRAFSLDPKEWMGRATLAAKRDTVELPLLIDLDQDFYQYLGLYVAEGYARINQSEKGFAQVYVAGFDPEIRNFLTHFGKKVGLKQTENKADRITFSSRLWYELIVHYFNCGTDAYSKRVPGMFFSAEKDAVGAFLRGYFEGDGSVSRKDNRVCCDSANNQLLNDIHLLLLKLGIFSRFYEYTKQPGPRVREFYIRKKKEIPFFTCTKLTVPSDYTHLFEYYAGFISQRKRKILSTFSQKKVQGMRIKKDKLFIYDPITNITIEEKEQTTYCLNVENHVVLANGILAKQCDGDEACVMLLMDALLNFSRQYLPNTRGAATMDSPLVLTSNLNPSEVDDQVHGMDVVWKYPLEFYEAALDMKNPWEVKSGPEKKKVAQLGGRLRTPLQYEQFGFTHPVSNFNQGVQCSAYKILPSMEEKLFGQMEIAKKVRAVDMDDVAKLVIQKHFLKDIRGNLKKFSMQQFRCVKCNAKYRRPPLSSKCTACDGKLIFTISEGSVVKYLGPSLALVEKYDFSPYLKQVIHILKTDVDHVFGREKEKQAGLGAFVK
ncbi:DNA polymerase II large subunit [Candidatus Woesearchaeota archaeon]|nr:DNA polymerase II large subunit [Candidatus Woesearchaeota archaeon]